MSSELKKDIFQICSRQTTLTDTTECYNDINLICEEIKNQIELNDVSLVDSLVREYIKEIETDLSGGSFLSSKSQVAYLTAIDCLCLLYANGLSGEVLDCFTRIMLPLPGKWVWIEGIDQTGSSRARWTAQNSFLATTEHIFEVLNHFLRELKSKGIEYPMTRLLIELMVSYSFLDFPWVTERSYALSNMLLCDVINISHIDSKIYEEILLETIKPLIVKARAHVHKAVSDEGRQKIRITKLGVGSVNYNSEVSDPERFEWSEARLDILGIYRFVLERITLDQIISNWSFLIPSLLNILDEPDPAMKLQAVKLIDILLHRISSLDPSLMKKSGVGYIFWESLLSCTTFLPPLTDSRLSIPLIKCSIRALVVLSKLIEPNDVSKRSLLLDNIMRDAILKGLTYSGSQDVKVAYCLVISSDLLIKNMGTYSLKHLQSMLGIIGSVMCDPFCTASLPLLNSTIELSISLIQYCWPRIGNHQYELLRFIAMAWKCVKEDIMARNGSDDELVKTKKNIEKLMLFLADAVGVKKIKTDTDQLKLIKDGYYEELFSRII
ncbi:hypothetical protein NADFUDRAFT_50586 [Nadsonia fulvescens var. elongata DSM 6958]|uniref:Uncharacterized protein n=1 Tax=Nadsonia fulvescens var. elongata DSM 6958 TaxID=857566 RepID=A0A1E3PMK4_9ASCO|nr:hypothetical protein NADFUDRAFT_50586 [Nadsonia fulvescens var. elongata DSM 6958]